LYYQELTGLNANTAYRQEIMERRMAVTLEATSLDAINDEQAIKRLVFLQGRLAELDWCVSILPNLKPKNSHNTRKE
jgi:hypothetical protein